MVVYVANFGRKNWAWSECLQRSIILALHDRRVYEFWQRRDREGFIQETTKYAISSSGSTVTRQVVSRWWNQKIAFAETSGDIWIHREKDDLWWTESPDSQEIEDEEYLFLREPSRRPSDIERTMVATQLRCSGWTNIDKRRRALRWPELHPKAREFLFTEGTLQRLSDDNALYAQALIDGRPLTDWHTQPAWKEREARGRRYAVTTFDARQRTIARMVMGVFGTVSQSGNMSLVIKKEKLVGFGSPREMETYLGELLSEQEGRCKLADLPMLFDDDDDSRLRCSVDRTDSSGDYTCGNIQLVCQFANFWKRNDSNEEFYRLLDAVRSV